MSLFNSVALTCPSCGLAQAFDAVMSVNADRRPDLRTAIIADEFQRVNCARCAAALRLDPEFTLLDQAQGLWISAAPLAGLARWKQHEDLARATFNEAYGAGASKGAVAIGGRLRVRLTFGWAALREKLFAADQGLDDVALELCKTVILRSGAPAAISATTELRLLDAQGDDLIFVWVDAVDQERGDSLQVSRSLYNDIAGDTSDTSDTSDNWRALRESLTAGPYVDINRVLIAQPA